MNDEPPDAKTAGAMGKAVPVSGHRRARAAALEKALRENLKRRKAAPTTPAPSSGPPEPDPDETS